MGVVTFSRCENRDSSRVVFDSFPNPAKKAWELYVGRSIAISVCKLDFWTSVTFIEIAIRFGLSKGESPAKIEGLLLR